MNTPIAERTAVAILALVVAGTTHAATFTYDFDALSTGTDNAASQLGGRWTTWSNAPGTSDDGNIVSNPASGGTGQALLIDEFDDLILSLGTASDLGSTNWESATPTASGIVTLGFDLYVGSGTGVYWNVQGLNGGSNDWAVDVYYGLDSGGNVAAGDLTWGWNSDSYFGNGSFLSVVLYDQWVHVDQTIDLDNGTYGLSIGGTQVVSLDGTDDFTVWDGLLGVDFYAEDTADTSPYHVDNVSATVPEPAPTTLLALGLAGMAARRIRRRA